MKLFISSHGITKEVAERYPLLKPALENLSEKEYQAIIAPYVKRDENFTFVGTVEGKRLRVTGRRA